MKSSEQAPADQVCGDDTPDDTSGSQRTRLEWAQWMAAKGINAFIVSPRSKRPLEGPSWYLRQSTHPEILEQWFEQTPDCNYGLNLGDKYAVIDLDVKPGVNGVHEFDQLCKANGVEHFLLEFETLMTKTPGGGYHIFFRVPFACSNKNDFPEGIDVRGMTGYVVGPGSKDRRGEWKIMDPDAKIMDLPTWLEDYLYEPGWKDPDRDIPLVENDLPESIGEATVWLKEREPAIEGQNGDDWTLQTFYGLRDYGISEDAAVGLAIESGWNDRCDPPWDPDFLAKKADNAYRYGQNRPGCKSPEWKAQRMNKAHGSAKWEGKLSAESIQELFHPTANDNAELVAARRRFEEENDIPGPDDEPASRRAGEDDCNGERPDVGAHLFNVRDFLKRGQRRKFVVARWLPAKGFTGLLAKRGTGKSAIMTDLAARIACGMDWQGLPIDPDYSVSVYLCGEDDDGLEMNLAGWEKEHARKIAADRLIISDKVMQLKDRKDVEAWADAIAERVGDRHAVVFLDTWQRATVSTKGQSADDEMAQCVENAESLLDRLNAPGIIAFHPPKAIKRKEDLTVMGSSVIENTSVAIWTLWENSDGLRLEVPRIKGAAKGTYIDFKLRKIVLDEKDQFGNPQTAVIPEKFADIGDSIDQKNQRQEAQRQAWGWLVRCLQEGQERGEVESFLLNRDKVARHAAKLMDEEDSQFYQEWGPIAKEAGLVAFSYMTIHRGLTEHFFSEAESKNHVDLDDGLRVTVKGKGRKRIFSIVRSPVARQAEPKQAKSEE